MKGGLQGRQLVVAEADLGEVVVLRRQRVELGLVALEALAGLFHLQGDPEGVELRAVGVEAAREGVVVHVAVPLHLALDLERRGRPALSHEIGDQRELADQLLGVLGHARARIEATLRRPGRTYYGSETDLRILRGRIRPRRWRWPAGAWARTGSRAWEGRLRRSRSSPWVHGRCRRSRRSERWTTSCSRPSRTTLARSGSASRSPKPS